MPKKKMFKSDPVCEVCGKRKAEFFDYNPKDRPDLPQGWYFTCAECPEMRYAFEISKFFHCPASTVDWIAHLAEKAWSDLEGFGWMMKRFRKATNSFFYMNAGE